MNVTLLISLLGFSLLEVGVVGHGYERRHPWQREQRSDEMKASKFLPTTQKTTPPSYERDLNFIYRALKNQTDIRWIKQILAELKEMSLADSTTSSPEEQTIFTTPPVPEKSEGINISSEVITTGQAESITTEDQYGGYNSTEGDGQAESITTEDQYGGYNSSDGDGLKETITTEDQYGGYNNYSSDGDGQAKSITTEDHYGPYNSSDGDEQAEGSGMDNIEGDSNKQPGMGTTDDGMIDYESTTDLPTTTDEDRERSERIPISPEVTTAGQAENITTEDYHGGYNSSNGDEQAEGSGMDNTEGDSNKQAGMVTTDDITTDYEYRSTSTKDPPATTNKHRDVSEASESTEDVFYYEDFIDDSKEVNSSGTQLSGEVETGTTPVDSLSTSEMSEDKTSTVTSPTQELSVSSGRETTPNSTDTRVQEGNIEEQSNDCRGSFSGTLGLLIKLVCPFICPGRFCPRICSCVQTNRQCFPTSEYSNNPVVGNWCRAKCAAGPCSPKLCVCD